MQTIDPELPIGSSGFLRCKQPTAPISRVAFSCFDVGMVTGLAKPMQRHDFVTMLAARQAATPMPVFL
jgi:hypothetical protein